MPKIKIIERHDRNCDVSLSITTKKGEERFNIKRGEVTEVPNKVVEALQNSYEKPYVIVLEGK